MKKGLIGTIILLVMISTLIISGRGIAVDVSIEERLANNLKLISDLEARIEALTKKTTDLEAKIATLETQAKANVGFKKATPSPAGIAKAEAIKSTKTSKTTNAKAKPTIGQVVYLNANGDKFHFWDGCTWYGYGAEYTITAIEGNNFELTNADGEVVTSARPCMLCEMHKVITQK